MKIALVTPAAAATRHGNWNTAARWARLLRLLWRAENDPGYYRLLKAQCRARRHLVTVGRERESLRRLFAEFAPRAKPY
ncbi:MAG TPA: hypothetical protein VFC14_14110 [Burkholderiales bacterium]|nr:hypothetical protein [Burkholderiales bacterium]